jgi:hypothetical protein
MYQCRQLNQVENTAMKNLKASRDSITHLTLKDGSHTAEKRSFEVTLREYKSAVLKSRDSVRQMKERIGNLNNLVNDLELQLSIQDFVSVPVHDTVIVNGSDSTRLQNLNYRDKWLSLSGMLYPDTLKLNYSVNAGLGIATYWNPDGFFKPKYLSVNVHSDNPHLQIGGMENFQIKEKKRFYQTRGFAFAAGALSTFLILR